MQGFAIYTVDGNVYFCDSYSFDTEGVRLDRTGVTLLVFIARNGANVGQVHKFPLARIDHIVDVTSGR